ncbi:MAG TPA: arabinofuranosidase catalytic domain-containing protein [Kutzneria sp.]|nr:arabinofuranosidase catalytic domain-containing protein [Kutzneria sp.]
MGSKLLLRAGLAAALVFGALFATNTTTPAPAQAATSLACDIYAAGGTPCVAAHSTTRALFAAYNGPLYQIQRNSDKKTLDIGVLAAGGVADSAPQVTFCASTSCTITKIYDQSTNHNDLPISWGGFWHGPGPSGSDIGANAMALPVTVGGHPAYGIKNTPGTGYRIDVAKNAPTGSHPEGVYMVTSSNYVNGQCCFDYGSGETSHNDTGNATMNAIEWGTACWFGSCVGSGPWVEADLENGMYHTGTGSNKDPNNPGVHFPFVSAWEKNNGTSNFTLKYGNATAGGLTTPYSGALPRGYSPMKTEASILLGTGGDNSNGGVGEFFEGAVVSGFPSDATENAVQADIAAAGYSAGSGGSTTAAVRNNAANRCLDVNNNSTTAGTQVQIWDCNSGANQTWTRSPAGELTVYSGDSMRCLDANAQGTTPGTKVIIWNCNGQTNQQWTVNADGTIKGVQSGLCLDLVNSGTTNGTLAQLQSCGGQASQKWTLG